MAIYPVQAPTTYLAGSGVIIGATTITVTDFVDIYGNVLTMADFGSKGQGCLEPDSNNEEAVTYTGITANANGTYTLTGVKSVLAKTPFTETSGLVREHAGGTKFVISDTAGFWNTFANKNNDETITGKYTLPGDLADRPTLSSDIDSSTNTDLVTVGQLSRQAIAGAANASTSVKGLVEAATQAEVDAKTTIGGTGALLFATLDTQRSTLLSDYKADTGAADAYVITPVPAISAYTVGQRFTFLAANTNTGASTLNVNGLGARAIKRPAGGDVLGGDITTGKIIDVEYDGTNFQVMNLPTTVDNVAAFGNGADGDVTISVNTSLTRDMYYNNLTINNAIVLSPSQYRVYVKNTLTNNGIIRANGNAGSAGQTGANDGFNTAAGGGAGGGGASGCPVVIIARSIINTGTIESNGGAGGAGGRGANATAIGGSLAGSAGGAGGVVTSAGTLPGNVAGSAGGSGASVGGAATAGTAVSTLINACGVAGLTGGTGGTGGSGGSSGAAGGSAGAVTESLIKPNTVFWGSLMSTIIGATTAFLNGSNSGSGGGGGGAQPTAGSGGGGGGAGGAGGSGGVIVLIYSYYNNTGTVQCLGGAAGAGGAGGTGSSAGTAGASGNAGNTGIIYQVTA